MPVPDPEFTRTLNAAIAVVITIIATIVLVAVWGRSSALARADRFSLRVRLPYGSESTRESVARGLRQRSVASALAILAGALVSAALLLTPLATSPLFIFYAIATALVAGNAVATVAVNLRERLFHPAPEAVRIARARTLTAADYLSLFSRLLPWTLAIGGAVALAVLTVTAVTAPDRLDATAAAPAFVLGGVAAVAFTALPWLERLILSQPQPATDTLELAWDDTFRASALLSLRLSCALAAWFALSLSVVALLIGSGSTWNSSATQLPTWGMLALQFAYPSTGRPLPAGLYPDWLRRPAPAASTT